MGIPATTEEQREPTAPIVQRWPNSPHTVTRARHHLRATLTGWGLDDLADPAELVLSELLTNAVRHARTPRGREIETRYEHTADGVRIEVHDASYAVPHMQRPATYDETGRGLALVDALTGARWGVSSRQGVGKLTWAHIGGPTA